MPGQKNIVCVQHSEIAMQEVTYTFCDHQMWMEDCRSSADGKGGLGVEPPALGDLGIFLQK